MGFSVEEIVHVFKIMYGIDFVDGDFLVQRNAFIGHNILLSESVQAVGGESRKRLTLQSPVGNSRFGALVYCHCVNKHYSQQFREQKLLPLFVQNAQNFVHLH